MPVLARWIEAAGIPTVVVTMMPDLATALFNPRTVGVEFPFGHPFGMPGDAPMQDRVLGEALNVLAGADRFGTRVDIDIEWPVPRKEAYKAWQPAKPSPITQWWLERNMLER